MSVPKRKAKQQNHDMNRSGGVVVFEVENRLPPLGYVYRYPA